MPIIEEDPLVQFLIDNFSYLMWLGGTYGFYHTRKWFIATCVLYVIMYGLTITTSAAIMYTCILLKDNVALFSQSFHVLIVAVVVLTASLTINSRRSKFKESAKIYLNPNISGYSKSDYFAQLERDLTKRKNVLIWIWVVGYGICGVIGVTHPMIDRYLERDLNDFNISGVYYKNFPLIMWWPLDAENTIMGAASLLFFQGICAFFAVVMIISAILYFFFTFDCLLNQIKLLTHAIKNLDKRARKLFYERYSNQSIEEMEAEFDDCYYECVVQNVKHHQAILDLLHAFSNLASEPVAVPFFGGAMLLGLSGINLLSDGDPRIGPKLLLVCMALTEALNMYLMCLYGETLQQLSAELFDAVFYVKWYKRSMKCRRALIILRYGCMEPLKLTAAKLITLNMETFSNMVNSAYSIFNLSSATSG